MLRYQLHRGRPSRVEGVEFCLLGDDEIRNISVSNVSELAIYTRGLPTPNGVNCHTMGTVDRRLRCGTCGHDVRMCPGHPGHLELAFPCYHVGMLETTLKLLRSVCFMCSRVCTTEADVDWTLIGRARLLHTYNAARTKRKCPHCGAPRPSYTRSGLGFAIEWDAATAFESPDEEEFCKRPFTAQTARSVLENVPDGDLAMLGFTPERSHPKHCVMNVISVPPPIARPAIAVSEGSRARGQDDLTMKLQDINKRNAEVRAALEAEGWDMHSGETPSDEAFEKIQKLQFDVYTFVNNSIRGQKQSTQRSGAPTKSVTDRLKGKDGRIRGNLMGKRVDFSARSVITPDACMDVDQVGVPETIALQLTIPVEVNSSNIRALQQRVRVGSKRLDGAETVITSNGTTIQLEFCEQRAQLRLQYGWIVERYLQDGDAVIFNRQPSLHKMGMMGHSVKIMQGHTFRLNLSCANPYNADFDGDEMNMHVPQSICASTEVRGIMMVHQQIISPQANKPVMGIVQDSLLGAYLLSSEATLITEREVMDLVHCISYPLKPLVPLSNPAVRHPRRLWTGLQVFSMLLPKSFDLRRGEPGQPGAVLIRRGQMLLGRLNKSLLGAASGGIIDTMYRDFGGRTTVDFMGDVQRLVNRWLAGRAFGVGISDCVLNADGHRRVDACLAASVENAHDLVQEASGHVCSDQLEGAVVQILSRLLMNTGSIVEECMGRDNAIRTMVKAGSKGNPINLSQICGCVGQQSVEGRRVHCDTAQRRTLSCFCVNDSTVHSHGLVQNSYALGLSPVEYFFHAMGGREGLVDTAVKTATTGYIQRRQVKAMEDNRLHYDGTVRNAESLIVQFEYGGDGYDACKLEKWEFPPICMSSAELRAWFVGPSASAEQEHELANAARLLKQLRSVRFDPITKAVATWITMPVNLPRVLHSLKRSNASDVVRPDVGRQVLSRLLAANATLPIRAALSVYLCSENLRRLCLSERALLRVEALVLERVGGASAPPGEMVGAIAAQSIGEPCTQLTLNTFHLAGVSNKNVSLGIPRLKELLDHCRNIRTPVNTIHLRKPFCFNEELVQRIADTLPLTKLSDIVTDVELCDRTHAADALIEELSEMYDPAPDGCSRLVARLSLNKALMVKRGIGPTLLRRVLRWSAGSRMHVTASETNSVAWVLLLRFNEVQKMLEGCPHEEAERVLVQRALKSVMDATVIGGHPKVLQAGAREMKCWDEETQTQRNEFVVDTCSSTLASFAAIPCVDWSECTTNDVNETYELLGIEAAAEVLFRQIFEVISFDGTYVDPRHIWMIVDTMTFRGYVMPLSRHGINRTDTGPLVRCSFEETVEVLYDAALFNETDCGKGVTQNVMVGQLPRLGTGCFDVQLPVQSEVTRAAPVKIAKSRVRQKQARQAEPRASLEYLRPQTWNWAECDSQAVVESPFEHMQAAPPASAAIFEGEDCIMPFAASSTQPDQPADENSRALEVEPYRPSSPCDFEK